jgi:hypothetical protein
MSQCNITDKELAEALDISLDQLADICEKFDEIPDDAWELQVGVHFEWTIHKARVFTPEGAVEICNYLEQHKEERPLHKRWERWLFQRDQRLKGLMITKRVQEASALDSQIVFRRGRAFLAPKVCREILNLGKRQDVLTQAFTSIQRPLEGDIEREPLKLDEDFFFDEEKRQYFSRTGIAAISRQLGTRLTQKHRQDWVKVVAEYVPRALETLEKHESGRQKRIKNAEDRIKKDAKGRCQITGRRKSVGKFNLVAHHLFDKNTYPQFADMADNLIAIGEDIHNQFHQWMGGTQKACTVEDMERFIEEFGHSLFAEDNVELAIKVRMRLSQSRERLRAIMVYQSILKS